MKRILVSIATGTWPKVAVVVFAAELVYLFVGTTIPVSQSTINQISSQTSSLASTVASLAFLPRAFYIFFNNLRLGALEVVPVFGWFIFGYSIYNTALAIEVLGIVQHIPGALISFTILIQPHTWLELPAYAIATTQSFYLFSTVARRSRFRFEAARTGAILVAVAIELILAGLLESLEVSLLSSLVLDFLIPWAIFAVLVGLLLAGRRWLLRSYYGEQITLTPFPNLFCPSCGSRLQEGAIYCADCGRKVT